MLCHFLDNLTEPQSHNSQAPSRHLTHYTRTSVQDLLAHYTTTVDIFISVHACMSDYIISAQSLCTYVNIQIRALMIHLDAIIYVLRLCLSESVLTPSLSVHRISNNNDYSSQPTWPTPSIPRLDVFPALCQNNHISSEVITLLPSQQHML